MSENEDLLPASIPPEQLESIVRAAVGALNSHDIDNPVSDIIDLKIKGGQYIAKFDNGVIEIVEVQQNKKIQQDESPVMDDEKTLGNLFASLSELPAKEKEELINSFAEEVAARIAVYKNPLPDIDLIGGTYELYQGKKISGDAIVFLGRVWGKYLTHFNPAILENLLSIAELKERDMTLYTAVGNAIKYAKRGNKELVSEGIVITDLSQLITPKLSQRPAAQASRYYKDHDVSPQENII